MINTIITYYFHYNLINHNYRPFNTKERNEVSCIKITKEHVTITNPAGTGEEYNFGFDYIYNVDCKQDDVWTNIGVPILGNLILFNYSNNNINNNNKT